MPLMRISLRPGKPAEYRRAIADNVYAALRETFNVPEGDFFATVTEHRPRAMQEAIEQAEADIVLVWPLCRETFSFTAYEAVAAGAAVITGPDSGNVAVFVAEGGHGLVLDDEAALAEVFASGAAAELSRIRRRPRLYDLKFSGLSVDLLEDRA